MRGEMVSRSAMPRSDRPAAASRATSSSRLASEPGRSIHSHSVGPTALAPARVTAGGRAARVVSRVVAGLTVEVAGLGGCLGDAQLGTHGLEPS